jgi:hypothetical protein
MYTYCAVIDGSSAFQGPDRRPHAQQKVYVSGISEIKSLKRSLILYSRRPIIAFVVMSSPYDFVRRHQIGDIMGLFHNSARALGLKSRPMFLGVESKDGKRLLEGIIEDCKANKEGMVT